MFKKLKDKIAEEVKSSPQRIQQLTQSVTEKIQNATSDESFFSIGDDEAPGTSPGFSNVSLSSYSTPNSGGPVRRNSSSSVASDMSFLPRYESATNLYHLQSDLDVSASEIEDNASTSSQLGHLSKEQIYAAFQKAQMRYHKYRGRYTDIANHYRELERENGKMKSVLVETQDKALRRVAELREQCILEQKAKAHLENALRVELDEKQYVIDTLKTKVNLLQTIKNGDQDKPELLVNIANDNNFAIDDEPNENNTEILAKDLKDAHAEIENLKEKLQEMKANSIVFNSKEEERKKKIGGLEETIRQKTQELNQILEREKENNLKTAQNKMELHTEIQNRDLEIENLKRDIETLRLDLEQYESKSKSSGKLENLQTQNAKLIEKVEDLTQKCNHYESELLKLETFRIEINNLNKNSEMYKNTIKELEDSKIVLEEKLKEVEGFKKNEEETLRLKINELEENILVLEKQNQEMLEQKEIEYDEKIAAYREDTKQQLLTLETKIKDKIKSEYNKKQEELSLEFQEKLQQLSKTDNNIKETHLRLMEKEEEVKIVIEKNNVLEDTLRKQTEKYKELETNHLELISESSGARHELSKIEKANCDMSNTITSLKKEMLELNTKVLLQQDEYQKELINLQELNNNLKTANDQLNNQIKSMQDQIGNLQSENSTLNKEITTVQIELSDIQTKTDQLKENNSKLSQDHFNSSEANKELSLENSKLQTHCNENKAIIEAFQKEITSLKQKLQDYENQIKTESNQQEELAQTKIKLEESQKSLEELNKTLENTKQNLQKKLKTQKVKFHYEIQTLSKDIAGFKEKNEEIQLCIDGYKQKLAEYEMESLKKTSHLEKLTNDNNELNEEINNLKKSLEVFKIENAELSKDLSNREDELSQKLAEVQQNTIKVQSLEKALEDGTIQLNLRLQNLQDENSNLNEQISHMQTENTNSNDQRKLQDLKIEELQAELVNYQKLKLENDRRTNEIVELKNQIENLSKENQKLHDELSNGQEQQKVYDDLLKESQQLQENYSKLLEETAELKKRNGELSLDYKQVSQENEGFLQEVVETKLKYETLETEKTKLDELIQNIQSQNVELEKELEHYKNEFEKLQGDKPDLERLKDVQGLETENKSLKNQLNQLEESCKMCEQQKKKLEMQVQELEHQYVEISHERQLLKDEILELKISPININANHSSNNNAEKLDTLDIIQTENIYSLEKPSDVQKLREDHEKEVYQLTEKLTQYKSLDLTNRSSIQFYENELQKLKNKNEKLNRKLDETLVTLNHCAELSNSTETEYLKNVLYNYMLGKEGLVLARVIAAVCKFDDSQTEAILQREQQKQTLLGQLGFI